MIESISGQLVIRLTDAGSITLTFDACGHLDAQDHAFLAGLLRAVAARLDIPERDE